MKAKNKPGLATIRFHLIFAENPINMYLALFLEILKYLLLATALYLVVRLAVKAYTEQANKKLAVDTALNRQQFTLPLQLQAYERVVLLVERITPSQLLHRVLEPGMTAYELQKKLVHVIREEYEHNLSQQVYISARAWNMVKKVKEDLILLINASASGLETDASGNDLARIFIGRWAENDSNPFQETLSLLKAEAGVLL